MVKRPTPISRPADAREYHAPAAVRCNPLEVRDIHESELRRDENPWGLKVARRRIEQDGAAGLVGASDQNRRMGLVGVGTQDIVDTLRGIVS